ncbi:hypothetical protein BKA69DRAFT_1057358 [Paraphysoderma sedebokerense]|nr:hypothetical protein BKA69DRAFT_1057358 [Paraphysoderma sedebokerense]
MTIPDPVILAHILVFLIFLCIPLNVTVLYIYRKFSLPASPSNILVINLCLCDLAAAVFNLPMFLQISISYDGSTNSNWLASNSTLCNLNGVVNQMLATQSVLTIFLLAMERYLSICTIVRMTKKLTIHSLYITWLISFLLATIPLFHQPAYVLQPSKIYCMQDLTATGLNQVGLRGILAVGLNAVLLFLLYSHYMITTEIRRGRTDNDTSTTTGETIKASATVRTMLKFFFGSKRTVGNIFKISLRMDSKKSSNRSTPQTAVETINLNLKEAGEQNQRPMLPSTSSNRPPQPAHELNQRSRLPSTSSIRPPQPAHFTFNNSPQPEISPILIASINVDPDSTTVIDLRTEPHMNGLQQHEDRAQDNNTPREQQTAIPIPQIPSTPVPVCPVISRPIHSTLEKMLFKRAVYICVAFIISWSFYNYSLLHSLISSGTTVGPWIDSLAMFFVGLNLKLNPFLTLYLDKRFRNGLEEMVMSIW